MADGSVKIIVNWDDSNVSKGIKQTQKEIESKLDDVQINAEVKATDKGIEELQEELEKIEDVTVNAKVDVDDTSIKTIEKTFENFDTEISPKISVDDKDIQETKKQLEKIGDTEIRIKATASNLESTINQINSLQGEDVKIDIVTDGSDIDEILKQIKSIENESAKVNITATGGDIDNILREIRSLDNENIKLNVNVDDSELKNVENQINNLSGTSIDLGAIAGTAGAIVGITALATSTQEYNEDLAKLKTNTDLANESFANAEQQLKNLNAITGETDSIVEALSNLMQAGFTGDNLASVVEQLSGAVIKFPDTLKIEGLSDGLQETLATGKAIGPFAELLERMGVDLEKFDKGLAKSAKTGDELNYIMSALNDLDLSKVNEQYREQNEAIVANRDAQFDLNSALAEIGTAITPLITQIMPTLTSLLTSLTPILVQIITAILPVLEQVLTAVMPILTTLITSLMPVLQEILQIILPPLIEIIESLLPPLLQIITELLPPLLEIVKKVLPTLLDILLNLVLPLVEITAQLLPSLVALITALLPLFDLWINVITFLAEIMTTVLLNAIQYIITNIQNIITILKGLITFITAVFAGDWSAAWSAISQTIGDYFSGMIYLVKNPINAIIALINGMVYAINTAIAGINSINVAIPDWVPGVGGTNFGFNIPKIPSVPYLARGGIVNRATQAVIGEDGTEAVIPLEKNTQGIQMIADLIAEKIGLSSEQVINLIVNLDGATVYKKMVQLNKKNTQQTGKNAFA